MPFPCKAAELRTRVMTFANRLIDAAGAADSEHGSNTSLCASLSHPGLPALRQLRWELRIESAVGELLSSWKAHLAFMVSQRQFATPAPTATDATTSPRPKRPRRAAPSPRGTKRPRSPSARPLHSQSKQARVERLRAAMATMTSSSSSAQLTGSSPSTPSTTLSGLRVTLADEPGAWGG